MLTWLDIGCRPYYRNILLIKPALKSKRRSRTDIKPTARMAGKRMTPPMLMPFSSDQKEPSDEFQLVMACSALRQAADMLTEQTELLALEMEGNAMLDYGEQGTVPPYAPGGAHSQGRPN